MSFTLSKRYNKRSFEVGSLKSAFLKTEEFLGRDCIRLIKASYRFPNEVQHEKKLTVDDLGLVIELSEPLRALSLGYYHELNTIALIFFIYDSSSNDFQMVVQSESIEQCRDVQAIFERELGISEADIDEPNKEAVTHSLPTLPERANLPRSKLEYPERVTMMWLFHNVPVSVWASFFSLLALAFGAGIAITETDFYKSLQPSAEEESVTKASN